MAAKNQTEDAEGPFNNRDAAYEAHWLCADIQKVLGTHIMETEGLTLGKDDDDTVQFYKFFKQVKDDLIESGKVDSSNSPLAYREQFETPDGDMWQTEVAPLVEQKLDQYGDDDAPSTFNITGFTEVPEDVAAEKLDIHYEDTQQNAIFLPIVDGEVFDPAEIMPDMSADETAEEPDTEEPDIDDGLAELEAELGGEEEDDEVTPDMDPDLGDNEEIVRIEAGMSASTRILEIAEENDYDGFDVLESEAHDTDDGKVGFAHVRWKVSDDEPEETEAEPETPEEKAKVDEPVDDEPDADVTDAEHWISEDNPYKLREWPGDDTVQNMDKQDTAIILKLDDPSRSFRKIEDLMENKYGQSYSSTSVGNALKRHYGDDYEAFKDWAKDAGKEQAKQQEEAGEEAAEEIETDDTEDELDSLEDDLTDQIEETTQTVDESEQPDAQSEAPGETVDDQPDSDTLRAAVADKEAAREEQTERIEAKAEKVDSPMATMMAEANVKQDAIDLNRVLIGASCRLAKEGDEAALARLYKAVMNVDEFAE